MGHQGWKVVAGAAAKFQCSHLWTSAFKHTLHVLTAGPSPSDFMYSDITGLPLKNCILLTRCSASTTFWFHLCHSWLHYSQSQLQAVTACEPALTVGLPPFDFISAIVGYITASLSLLADQLCWSPTLLFHLCHSWLLHSQSVTSC